MIRVAPSILTADFGQLASHIRSAETGGADWLHLDVMDGSFVPEISFGPVVVKAARSATSLPLDVHLMVSAPERHIRSFADAGADLLTVHAEASLHLHRTLMSIREHGMKTGLAVNPLTPLQVYRDALPLLDLALIMSVSPGYGGQAFIPGSTRRIASLRSWRDELNPDCLISVDGGISTATIRQVRETGADVVVAGSSVYNAEASVQDNIAALREAAG